ncbi:hypothetical protein U1Q18_023769 [Sarracenia purpurea var. burkii]
MPALAAAVADLLNLRNPGLDLTHVDGLGRRRRGFDGGQLREGGWSRSRHFENMSHNECCIKSQLCEQMASKASP